jgi:hypothetical protein
MFISRGLDGTLERFEPSRMLLRVIFNAFLGELFKIRSIGGAISAYAFFLNPGLSPLPGTFGTVPVETGYQVKVNESVYDQASNVIVLDYNSIDYLVLLGGK